MTENNYQEVEITIEKISDHLLPLFKEKSAKQILNIINHSHIQQYSDEEKENTELRIRELLKEHSSE